MHQCWRIDRRAQSSNQISQWNKTPYWRPFMSSMKTCEPVLSWTEPRMYFVICLAVLLGCSQIAQIIRTYITYTVDSRSIPAVCVILLYCNSYIFVSSHNCLGINWLRQREKVCVCQPVIRDQQPVLMPSHILGYTTVLLVNTREEGWRNSTGWLCREH